jgi:thiol-disulfide isomerase/thioredoxin
MTGTRRVVARSAAALLLGSTLAAVHCRSEPPFRAGEAAPELRLQDLAGRDAFLSSLRGQVVVLNLWATWCPPCLVELPSLDRLHKALHREGLSVVAVSVDEPGTDVAGFMRERGLALPVLRDPGGREAARKLHVGSYPTTFVIDAEGRMRARYLGVAEWDVPEALDHFRGLIAERTSPTR